MRAALTTFMLTAFVMGSMAGSARGQGLSGNDRLLLYYNSFYKTPRDTRDLLRAQDRFQTDLSRVQTTVNTPSRMSTGDEAIERYIRSGGRTEQQKQSIPPIYAGRPTNTRQYFMRINYFEPAQTTPQNARTYTPSFRPRRFF